MNEHELRTMIARLLRVAPARVTSEANLVSDLAADSLSLAELICSVEKKIGVQLPLDVLQDVATVGDLEDLLRTAQQDPLTNGRPAGASPSFQSAPAADSRTLDSSR